MAVEYNPSVMISWVFHNTRTPTMRHHAAIAAALLVLACSDPKSTVVPAQLDKMESIKTSLEKLTTEEKELFAGYVARHTIGAAAKGMFGIKAEPMKEGITIGAAIDEQRQFIEQEKKREEEERLLRERIKAEKEKAMQAMRDAVTVTLLSRKIKPEYGYSGIVTDENITIAVAYKNNTDKEVAGVKGRLTIKDIFGDEVTAFYISNSDTIKPGNSIEWKGGRSVKFGMNNTKDRKFADLDDDKFTVTWEPEMVVFKDGTKLSEKQ